MVGRAGRGPSGRALDFRQAARSAHAAVDELGALLQNVAQAVPQVVRRGAPPPAPAHSTPLQGEVDDLAAGCCRRRCPLRPPFTWPAPSQCSRALAVPSPGNAMRLQSHREVSAPLVYSFDSSGAMLNWRW